MCTYEDAIDKVLEDSGFPHLLQAQTLYSRVHDDHDGMFEGSIEVIVSPDGDVWVNKDTTGGLRFRTRGGGGQSVRVRNALVVLAEAIRRDTESNPQTTAAGGQV